MAERTYSDALVALAEAWDKVAYHCGDATDPESPCAIEARALPDAVESPEDLTRAIAQDAATYVSAASQNLRALARLLGPDAVLAGWPVTRGVAEYCGRVGWLLDMSGGVTPTNRAARFYMERIVSAHHARLAAEKIGSKGQVKDLKTLRASFLTGAKVMFADAALFESLEAIGDWSVGGEAYAGLGKAVNDFGGAHLGSRGLYDVLSSFTHPSLVRLRQQVSVTQLEDRLHHAFVIEGDVLRWQVSVACAAVYRAAHHVVAYLALDDAALEEWGDAWEDLLSFGG